MAVNLQWNSKYEIGHERIDSEHRVFLSLIRAVSEQCEQPVSAQWLDRLLFEVRKYADFHFYSEETIMISVDYPDYELHKKEHSMLLATLDSKLHDFRVGEIGLPEIVQFMFEWFALHTTHQDKKLAQFVREH